jgi:hypothetical protein
VELPTEAVPSPSRSHAAIGRGLSDRVGEAEVTAAVGISGDVEVTVAVGTSGKAEATAVGTSGVDSFWGAQAASAIDMNNTRTINTENGRCLNTVTSFERRIGTTFALRLICSHCSTQPAVCPAFYAKIPQNHPTEIPRRINSTNIFTSKGDDFDKLGLIIPSFPPFCIIFRDPFHKIGHWKWFFQPGLNRNNGLRYAKRVFFSR